VLGIARKNRGTAAMPTTMPSKNVSTASAIRKGRRFLAGDGTEATGTGGFDCGAEGSVGVVGVSELPDSEGVACSSAIGFSSVKLLYLSYSIWVMEAS
jgi:hypothetical protein